VIVLLFLIGLFYQARVTHLLWNNLGNVCFIKSLVVDEQNAKENSAKLELLNCAVSFFLQARSDIPSVHNLRSLALAYLDLKQYRESQNMIQEAIHIAPTHSLFFDAGRIYEAAGNRQAAIWAWQKSNAVEYFLDRGNREIYFEDRLYNYELAIQIAPNSPRPYYTLGDFLYYNSSEREKAIELYQAAVVLDQSQLSQRYFALGKIAQYHADWSLAVHNYQQAIKVGGGSANLYMELGDALSQVDANFEMIQHTYEKAFAVEPLNPWPYWKMRNLYINTNQYDALLIWYQIAIAKLEKEKPEASISMLLTLVKMHTELGDCEISTYLYKRAREFDEVSSKLAMPTIEKCGE